jgi:hypothetical protein
MRMTTCIEQVNDLRQSFLKEIDEFFSDNNIISIDFEPKENDLDIDPASLTNEGALTVIDEFGNDYDIKLSTMSIDVIALILDLIHDRKYDINN